MWKKYLSILAVFFAVLGYTLASFLHSRGVVDNLQTSQIYLTIKLIKDVFFSSLKMLITPIVFVSLLSGLLQISNLAHVGRIGKTTLIYFMSTVSIAIVIGLTVVFFIHPWTKYQKDILTQNQYQSLMVAPEDAVTAEDTTVLSVIQSLANSIFVNPVDAFVKSNILGLVFWALLIGIALIAMGAVDPVLIKLIHQANEVLTRILAWVILFVPIGVFAVAFTFYFQFSNNLIQQLISFCIVVFGATMLHGVVVLPLILWIFTRISVFEFFKKSSKALLLALTTSSSNATLPVTLQVCNEEFKINKSVSSFVVPLGATVNMDGTALFEGVAAVFLAHLFGIELNTASMFGIFFMAMFSSIGAPGMPSASMAAMQMVLLAAGIPLEGIGILLVVERPLDTFRTAVNVEGDIIGALIVNEIHNRKTS